MGQLHSLNWERGLDSLGEINLLSYHTFLLQRHLLFNRDCPAIQCPTMQARCRSQARPIREESTTWGILKPASSHLVIRMICHKFLSTTSYTFCYTKLQHNCSHTSKQRSNYTSPKRNTTDHHRRRSTRELHRATRIRTTRRRRPRGWERRRSTSRQVLHTDVVRSKWLRQSSIAHKLAHIEADPVLREICIRRWNGEVGRLSKEDERVAVRHVADGRRWLQVWNGRGWDAEERAAGAERDVGCHPVEKLDAGSVARHVEVDHEEDGGSGR